MNVRTGLELHNIENISITNFSLLNNRLQCNLTASAYNSEPATLNLASLGVTEIKAIGNIQNLTVLDLRNNQLTYFNPSISLPSTLTNLYLNTNQINTAGYTTSETWANLQNSFTNLCTIRFTSNTNSVTGTNLKSILETKNANVIA